MNRVVKRLATTADPEFGNEADDCAESIVGHRAIAVFAKLVAKETVKVLTNKGMLTSVDFDAAVALTEVHFGSEK